MEKNCNKTHVTVQIFRSFRAKWKECVGGLLRNIGGLAFSQESGLKQHHLYAGAEMEVSFCYIIFSQLPLSTITQGSWNHLKSQKITRTRSLCATCALPMSAWETWRLTRVWSVKSAAIITSTLGKCTNARCVYGRAARIVTYLVGRCGRGNFRSQQVGVGVGTITRLGTFAPFRTRLHEAR